MAAGDSVIRQVAIVAGTALTLSTIPLSLIRFRLTRALWIQLTVLAILMGLIEFGCQYHLAEGDGVKQLPVRLVAYAYALAGWLMGATNTYRESRIPMPVQWTTAVVALGAGMVWMRLSFALSAQGSRFSASDDLHPVGLGLLFGVSACVCFGILFTSAWNSLRVAILPACIVLIGCMLTTGSRGALLSLVLALSIVACSRMKSVKSVVGMGLLASVLVATVLAAVTFVPEVREQLNFTLERFSRIGEGNDDAALMERTEIRTFYFTQIQNWLWLGIENYDMTRYPHNIFLELFIRFGVVLGGAVSLAILVSAVRSLRWLFTERNSTHDAISFMITLLGLFGLVISQFNLALEFSRTLWLFTAYWFAKSATRGS